MMKLALWNYRQLTKDFEGLRLKPYRCSAGKLTIGYGRNLEDVGIDEKEASMLFERDWAQAEAYTRVLLTSLGKDWEVFPENRFYVLSDMIFNMGYNNVLKFKKMLEAIKKDDYNTAADQMLDSKWASLVGNRATKLAALMRS